MNVASPMMLQAASFAQSIMIGKIHSTLLATFSHLINSLNPSYRVHANLRDASPGYNYMCSFFLHCLYLDEAEDPKDPNEGFPGISSCLYVSILSIQGQLNI